MIVDDLENLRIRVASEVNERLSRFCDKKRISKQDVIDGMLRWFLDQEDLVQSLIAGQLTPNAALLEMVKFWAKADSEDEHDIEFKMGKTGLIATEVKRPRARRAPR